MTLKEFIEKAKEKAKQQPETEQGKKFREAYQNFVQKLKEKKDEN